MSCFVSDIITMNNPAKVTFKIKIYNEKCFDNFEYNINLVSDFKARLTKL